MSDSGSTASADRGRIAQAITEESKELVGEDLIEEEIEIDGADTADVEHDTAAHEEARHTGDSRTTAADEEDKDGAPKEELDGKKEIEDTLADEEDAAGHVVKKEDTLAHDGHSQLEELIIKESRRTGDEDGHAVEKKEESEDVTGEDTTAAKGELEEDCSRVAWVTDGSEAEWVAQLAESVGAVSVAVAEWSAVSECPFSSVVVCAPLSERESVRRWAVKSGAAFVYCVTDGVSAHALIDGSADATEMSAEEWVSAATESTMATARQWTTAVVTAALGGIGSGRAHWTHVTLAAGEASRKDEGGSAPAQVPTDADLVVEDQMKYRYKLMGDDTLITKRGLSVDLKRDVKEVVKEGTWRHSLTLNSGTKIRITEELYAYLHFTFSVQELLEKMSGVMGEVVDRDTREAVRKRVYRAGCHSSEDALLSGLKFAMKSLKRHDFIAPCLEEFKGRVEWGKGYHHWTELISEAQAWAKEEEWVVLFKECLWTVGIAAKKGRTDALSFAKSSGHPELIRACMAYVRSESGDSSSEESRALAYSRWRAQCCDFASFVRSERDGAACMEVLDSAMCAFIDAGGDWSAVDVIGALCEWSPRSAGAMRRSVSGKVSDTLRYASIHADKCGWSAVSRVLAHPLWLCDSMFADLVKHVDAEVEGGGTEIADGFTALIAAESKAWRELCAFSKVTTATRQDEVAHGSKAELSEAHLLRVTVHSDALLFNALRMYDTGAYMLRFVTIGHLLNPIFAKAMQRELGGFGEVKVGPVKMAERIAAKSVEYAAEGRRWPHSSCVIDVIRCSVAVSTLFTMVTALTAFSDYCESTRHSAGLRVWIVRCKNGFGAQRVDDEDTPVGVSFADEGTVPTRYTDVKLNVAVCGVDEITGERMTVIGEVQFLLDCILAAKLKGHELYSVKRREAMVEAARRKAHSDYSLKQRLLRTGGYVKHLAAIVSEFPRTFALDRQDWKVLLHSAHRLEGMFLDDLGRTIARSNTKKSIQRELTKAIVALIEKKCDLIGAVALVESVLSEWDTPQLVRFWNEVIVRCCRSSNYGIFDRPALCRLLSGMNRDVKRGVAIYDQMRVCVGRYARVCPLPSLREYCAIWDGLCDDAFTVPLVIDRIEYMLAKECPAWTESIDEQLAILFGCIPTGMCDDYVFWLCFWRMTDWNGKDRYPSHPLLRAFTASHCPPHFDESVVAPFIRIVRKWKDDPSSACESFSALPDWIKYQFGFGKAHILSKIVHLEYADESVLSGVIPNWSALADTHPECTEERYFAGVAVSERICIHWPRLESLVTDTGVLRCILDGIETGDQFKLLKHLPSRVRAEHHSYLLNTFFRVCGHYLDYPTASLWNDLSLSPECSPTSLSAALPSPLLAPFWSSVDWSLSVESKLMALTIVPPSVWRTRMDGAAFTDFFCRERSKNLKKKQAWRRGSSIVSSSRGDWRALPYPSPFCFALLHCFLPPVPPLAAAFQLSRLLPLQWTRSLTEVAYWTQVKDKIDTSPHLATLRMLVSGDVFDALFA